VRSRYIYLDRPWLHIAKYFTVVIQARFPAPQHTRHGLTRTGPYQSGERPDGQLQQGHRDHSRSNQRRPNSVHTGYSPSRITIQRDRQAIRTEPLDPNHHGDMGLGDVMSSVRHWAWRILRDQVLAGSGRGESATKVLGLVLRPTRICMKRMRSLTECVH
jgi:hypothetical protein